MILNYLNSHKKTIFLFFLAVGIFALVFYLSSAPLDAVLYAGLLVFLAVALFTAFDFYRFRKQHRELQYMSEAIDVQPDLLPPPRNQIEADYMELILNLHRKMKEGESKAYIERKELVDYFTLWTHQIKTPISAMGLVLQSRKGEQLSSDRELSRELFSIEEYVNTALSYFWLVFFWLFLVF